VFASSGVGCRKNGRILLQAFLKNNLVAAEQIFSTVQHAERAQACRRSSGLRSLQTTGSSATGDVILLGVNRLRYRADRRDQGCTDTKKMVSFAASVKTRSIEDGAGCELAVIRAMPNTPAMLAAGITALCAGRFVSAEQMAVAQKIFHTVGKTVVVDEKHMDAVTGLFGIGPAFFVHHHRGPGGGWR